MYAYICSTYKSSSDGKRYIAGGSSVSRLSSRRLCKKYESVNYIACRVATFTHCMVSRLRLRSYEMIGEEEKETSKNFTPK